MTMVQEVWREAPRVRMCLELAVSNGGVMLERHDDDKTNL